MRIPSLLPTLALALIVSSGPALRAQDVELQRVWPSYRDAASFTRLSEYFGGSPDAANRDALRTHPEARAGYYWLIRTVSATDLAGCSFQLRLQRDGQPDSTVHTFPYNLTAGSHAVNLGLTGADWPDSAERPLAWQLSLIAPNGTPLVSEQSFLWQQPTD